MKYAFIPVLAVAAIAGFFLIKYNMDNKVQDRLDITPTTEVFVNDRTEEEEEPVQSADMVGQFSRDTLVNVYNQFSTISGEECSMVIDESGDMPVETGVLGGSNYAILPCDLYAYNVRNFVVVESMPGVWEIVMFETYNPETKQKGPMTAGLINAAFDAMKDELFTFNKARGLGDCGTSEVYTLDATTKQGTLIKVTGKMECDGQAGEWPVLYSAS